jgi:phosphoribosylaminoimidazole carboxylase PurE protein
MAEFETGIEWEETPIDLVMGSDSDALVVEQTAGLLERFDVPYNSRIISAHRTHSELDEYCEEVVIRESDLVIVAFAGMSAALGGDTAARVPNTVIGVPLQNSADTMNASTAAQLYIPPGSGLTIVGPNQAVNAGLAALRTLGTSRPEVRQAITNYQHKNRDGVIAKDQHLQEVGIHAFADQKRPKK